MDARKINLNVSKFRTTLETFFDLSKDPSPQHTLLPLAKPPVDPPTSLNFRAVLRGTLKTLYSATSNARISLFVPQILVLFRSEITVYDIRSWRPEARYSSEPPNIEFI
jgi:hypothetical protein